MKLAIMQPYFFPYIGYFQLINSVDKYIIYDNLNFIKKAWINRNYILVNKSSVSMITVPLKHKSSYTMIRDIEIDDTKSWRDKLKKLLHFNYCKSPMYKYVYPILEDSIDYPTDKISRLNTYIIKSICSYLKIKTIIESNSDIYQQIENNLSDKEFIQKNYKNIDRKMARILEICKLEKADIYYNAIGGFALYPKDIFAENKIMMKFIKTKDCEYKQYENSFVPKLSIIDVLMFNSLERIKEMLNNFELI